MTDQVPPRVWPGALLFFSVASLLAFAVGWWGDALLWPALLLFGVMELLAAVTSALTATGWGDETWDNWRFFFRWTGLNAAVVAVMPVVAALRR